MAQLEEKLGALLADEEGRQRFLQLASMLGGSGAPSSDQPTAESTEQAATDENTETTAAGSSTDKTGALFEALPRLLQALSGSGEELDSKKVNLIRALSPYLKSTRSQYIDRAIRMASVAKAARDTLGLLGR